MHDGGQAIIRHVVVEPGGQLVHLGDFFGLGGLCWVCLGCCVHAARRLLYIAGRVQ